MNHSIGPTALTYVTELRTKSRENLNLVFELLSQNLAATPEQPVVAFMQLLLLLLLLIIIIIIHIYMLYTFMVNSHDDEVD